MNMFASQFRVPGIALALLLPLMAGSIYCWSGNAPPASAAPPQDAKVTTLLQERLDTLKAIAAQTAKDYESGYSSVVQVHEAAEAVLRAELDLADSQKARIAIHEKLVAEAKKHEEHVANLAKTGKEQNLVVLRAKVHRLEAEIALEREKAKQPDK
jgi:septal ring factor EnvC (AmiA/AmiB activator)